MYAHGEGEAVVTAYAPDGKSVEFHVTASLSADREYANAGQLGEAGTASGEGETGSDVTQPATQDSDVKENKGMVSTLLLVAGIILLGVAAFAGSMKLAAGSGKKDKK